MTAGGKSESIILAYFDIFWSFFSAFGRLAGVLAVLLVIVTIHELGHYLVGRWCGIKASVFSVGFGPELLARVDRSGTRWRLAALPLGGYVRFLDDRDAELDAAEFGGKVKRDTASPRGSFAAAGPWRRAATVFAGPLFNGILAVLILSFMAFYFGKFAVSPVVGRVLPNSPAAASGLQPGDRFITMNGAAVAGFEDISRYVSAHDGEPIHFLIERGDKPLNLIIAPKIERVDDGFGNIIRIGRLGIVGSDNPKNISKKSYGLGGALAEGFKDTGFIISRTGQYLGKLVQGRGDRCQLSGPVRTAEIAWKVSDFGIWALVQLAALLSVGIGLFNLLPMPPLDGGHLLFYLAEGVTGRPAPRRAQEIVFRLGWIIILLFTVFAILNNSVPC